MDLIASLENCPWLLALCGKLPPHSLFCPTSHQSLPDPTQAERRHLALASFEIVCQVVRWTTVIEQLAARWTQRGKENFLILCILCD